MNRRMFLRTAGGAAVSMPFLGSLEPARAGTPAPNIRFVAMATQHGAVWESSMWPTDALLTETQSIGHTIRRGDLVPTTQGPSRVLSQVLTADQNRLTPSVLAQLNVLRGLDIPFYIGHHTGGYLGNYGRNDGEFETSDPIPYLPTIDQVMAWSPGFYGSLGGVVQRSVHIGHPMSWGWSNPTAQSGSVDGLPTTWSSQALFDSLFGGGSEPSGPERRLVVDRVLESYRLLRDGAFGPARRMSAGDRQRLDDHMERLYEVERRLGSQASCGDIVPPTDDTEWHPGAYFESLDLGATFTYHQLWNEVLALGLICGATRIATYNCLHTFEPYAGDWHQDIAHQAWVDSSAEQTLARGQQRFFDRVFCDLASRLDVPDADGNTVLHNSLLFWAQESGPSPHDPITLPVITAGSAGGAMRTGQYVDYRDRGNTAFSDNLDNAIYASLRPGLLYGQFLASCLNLTGVSTVEWSVANNPGYGLHLNENPAAWPAHVEAIGNDTLPFLAA